MPSPSPILLDGQWSTITGRPPRPIHNPATLELLGSTADCGAAEVDAAVHAAVRAQRSWWKVPGVEKAKLLHEVATKIRAMETELSTLLTRETGKPLIESVDCIDWVAACFDYYAEVGRQSYGTSAPPATTRP